MNQYKYLETEIEKMWHLKTTTILVIVGTLEMTWKEGANTYLSQKSFIQNLNSAPWVLLLKLENRYATNVLP